MFLSRSVDSTNKPPCVPIFVLVDSEYLKLIRLLNTASLPELSLITRIGFCLVPMRARQGLLFVHMQLTNNSSSKTRLVLDYYYLIIGQFSTLTEMRRETA